MFATAVRWIIHQVSTRNPHFKKMGIAPEELPTQKVLKIVREQGPILDNDCWKHAQEAGIKSKNQMKRLLQWLRDKNLVYLKCTHTSGDKQNQHDLIFHWRAVVFPPHIKYRQKIKDKRYYKNLELRAKKEKLRAERAVFKARKLEKARRIKQKEAELAKLRLF